MAETFLYVKFKAARVKRNYVIEWKAIFNVGPFMTLTFDLVVQKYLGFFPCQGHIYVQRLKVIGNEEGQWGLWRNGNNILYLVAVTLTLRS